MNKEMFLKELSDRLQILNEKERQDLLDEYAQHIDMKIENGMSEEDAVKDFGALEELCAELLDVYHINSEYASAQNRKKKLFENIPIPGLKREAEVPVEKTEEQIAQELEEKRLKEAEKRAQEEARRVLSEQRKAERSEKSAKWRAEYGMKVQEWKEKRHAKRILRKEKYEKMREQYQIKKLERQAYRAERGGSLPGRFCKGIWKMAVILVALCWKFCLFCFAAPIAFLGLCALFGTGMTGVLVNQGYPLTGVTMIGAGVFLASAGLAGLLLSFVFSRKEK